MQASTIVAVRLKAPVLVGKSSWKGILDRTLRSLVVAVPRCDGAEGATHVGGDELEAIDVTSVDPSEAVITLVCVW